MPLLPKYQGFVETWIRGSLETCREGSGELSHSRQMLRQGTQGASVTTLLTPKPPYFTGRVA